MSEINIDELDLDGESTTFKGTPFTGISYVNFSNGKRAREYSYKNGLEDGLCREWYFDGQLKKQWFGNQGFATSGEIKKWFENGSIQSIGQYEFGVALEYKEWDKDGNILKESVLPTDSPLHNFIAKMRRFRAKRESNVP